MGDPGKGTTSINLGEEIKARLDAIGERFGLSRSAIIVRLINHGLPALERDLEASGASPILLATLPPKSEAKPPKGTKATKSKRGSKGSSSS